MGRHARVEKQIKDHFFQGSFSMSPNDLITAWEAAQLFSMSINAFRIHLHKYGKDIKRYKLGKRRILFSKKDLLSLLEEV